MQRRLKSFGNKRRCNSQTPSQGDYNSETQFDREGQRSSSSHISETHDNTDVGGPSVVGNSATDIETSNNHERCCRGKTRLEAVWNAPLDAPKIKVHVNKHEQGVGKGSSNLSQFIGTLARKPGALPLTYKSWLKVPKEYKVRALAEIKERYEFPPNLERWVLMQLGNKWKEYKHRVKVLHFSPTKSVRDLKKKVPKDIEKNDWYYLVDYWMTNESNNIASINKRNRAKLTLPHTSGSKSHATLREEEMIKTGGVEPSRAAMFIKTHQRKDGTPINVEVGDVIDQLKEAESQLPEGSQSNPSRTDVLSQVLGEDSHGRVRTMGLGVTPSRLWPPEHVLHERVENEQLRRRVIELEEQQRLVTEQQRLATEQQMLVAEQQRKMMADQQEQQQMMTKLLGGLGATFGNNEMVQTLLASIQGPQAPPPSQ